MLAGDPAVKHFVALAALVSIRARHCWRAILHGRAAPARNRGCFNPRPPLLAGDPGAAEGLPLGFGGFNPRPPLLAGDPASPRRARQVLLVFQSAPAIAGGRSPAVRQSWQSGRCCFNPRPPLLAGDPGQPRRWRRGTHVSIRARHCWRAILFEGVFMATKRTFQSAPAIAGGRSFLSMAVNLPTAVSIRARHCWRAIRQCPAARRSCFLFQSAPAIAGGRCINSFARCWVVAVSIRARHCWRAMPSSIGTISASINCFNPRPPLLAGDAHQVVERWLACHPVSIRARHCWRAMP